MADEIGTKGDFTIYRFVKSLGREDLELKVGFDKGRLDQGAIVCVMVARDLAELTTTDFILGASTRWSRSQAPAAWAPEYTHYTRDGGTRMEDNAIESKLALEGQDVAALKRKVLRFFQTSEDNSPAKVLPTLRHRDGMEYPSAVGGGIPQFKLLNTRKWRIVRRIPAL